MTSIYQLLEKVLEILHTNVSLLVTLKYQTLQNQQLVNTVQAKRQMSTKFTVFGQIKC